MASQVLMPALSPTMTEGKIARWVKSVGDTVHAGDVLAEIETDKATMEVEAVDEGVLARIVIPEGTDHVAVNTPIALIAENGEDIGAAEKPRPPNIVSHLWGKFRLLILKDDLPLTVYPGNAGTGASR